jgi:tripartite-type tricarboxylate transporter receptor subunit TctC
MNLVKLAAVSFSFAMASPTLVYADSYPSRPVKLIVGFSAGGIGDVMGRLFAQGLQKQLKQTFYVENKPGADGTIGMREAIKADPDGYTLLVGGLGAQIIPQLMRDDFPIDTRSALEKIAITGIYPNVLTVNKDVPVNSVKELIAYLKERPGKLNFGSSGRVSTDRLAAELFMMESGTRMLNVPYKGGALALNDLISGQTQIMFPQLPVVAGAAKSGQVKALAVTTLKRAIQMPEVPTMSEAGLPGFNVGGWNAIYGPRGMPKNVLDILGKAAVAAVQDPEILARLADLGVQPLGMASEEATIYFDSEFVRWQKVVDGAGLRLQK